MVTGLELPLVRAPALLERMGVLGRDRAPRLRSRSAAPAAHHQPAGSETLRRGRHRSLPGLCWAMAAGRRTAV